MTLGPQSSTAPRELGDLHAVAQAAHIGIPELGGLIADNHLIAAHTLPNGVTLYDLHPNRISTLKEIHENRRPKFRL